MKTNQLPRTMARAFAIGSVALALMGTLWLSKASASATPPIGPNQPPAKPDLTITAVSPGYYGGVVMWITVHNQGAASSNACWFRMDMIEPNQKSNPSYSLPILTLAPGQYYTLRSPPIPYSYPGVKIHCEVDFTHLISESNENNNTRDYTF